MRHKIIFFILTLLLLIQPVTASAITLYYDETAHEYSEKPITMIVNGETVNFDMPPVIINERTLIPVRGLFEKLGAAIEWDGAAGMVKIVSNETTILLWADHQTASVNGQSMQMDVAPKIINDRMMIPVRFISESLGYQVGWDGITATVTITGTTLAVIQKIAYADGKITVTADAEIGTYEDFVLKQDGEARIVLDLAGTKLGYSGNPVTISGSQVKGVRWSQYQTNPYITRIVVDLSQTVSYVVEQSADKRMISIALSFPSPSPSPTPTGAPVGRPDYTLNEKAKEKLVVIDPGHGGDEVGSEAKQDGRTIAQEKDINLAISLKLNALLKQAGVKTYMTREDDSTVGLFDRPEIANNLNADLFVSVHSNSFTSPDAYGTETLYYPGGDASYGITSQRLAQLIQEEMVKELGTYDRGLKDGKEMVVIRKTNMPAVIAEVAFLSSPDDLAKLLDDSFRQKAAQAICNAIIRALNEMVE